MYYTSQHYNLQQNYRAVFNEFQNFAEFKRKDHIFVADTPRWIFVQGKNDKILLDSIVEISSEESLFNFSEILNSVENDVHILGISSLAAGHKTLVPQVIAELKNYGREDIMVIVGGVIPAQDYDYLFERKVAAVFGPGTVISESAITIMDKYLTKE